MISCHLHPRIVDAICKIVNRRSLKTETRQGTKRARSKPTCTRRGVPQGSSLGPILFALEVDSLLHLLHSEGITATMFSDDLALLFQWLDSESIASITGRVQTAVNLVVNWCQKHFFKINKDKCSHTIFGSPSTTPLILWIDSTLLVHENTPKYLGVRIGRDYTISQHVDNIIDNIRHRMISLYLIRGKDWGISTTSTLMLLKSFVWPQSQYCLSLTFPMMSSREATRVQRAINTALRIVVNAPMTTRLEVLWKETNSFRSSKDID